MDETTIDHGIATGRLYPIFRAAFGVGHPPLRRHSRLMAAVLACGEGSVLSHGTAAALLGLWEHPPDLIDVIAPVQAGRKIDGIFRRHTPPPPAARQDRPRGHSVHQPFAHHRRPRRHIEGEAPTPNDRTGGRPQPARPARDRRHPQTGLAVVGSPLLRTILEDWRGHDPATRLRSPLEARLVPMLAARGLPTPQWNEELTVARRAVRGRLRLASFPPRRRGRQSQVPRQPGRPRSRFPPRSCPRIGRISSAADPLGRSGRQARGDDDQDRSQPRAQPRTPRSPASAVL